MFEIQDIRTYQISLLSAQTEAFLWSFCKKKTHLCDLLTSSYLTAMPVIEPGPVWWEPIELTTEPARQLRVCVTSLAILMAQCWKLGG